MYSLFLLKIKYFVIFDNVFLILCLMYYILLEKSTLKGEIMKLERKFFLRIIDDQQKEIFTYNKGKTLNYQEVKKHILDELQNIDPALYHGDFYICIICESGELYQCIQYKWLFAQYAFDTSKNKNAFAALLDFMFIYGEWTNFYKIPKNLMRDLNDQIQKQKDEDTPQNTLKWKDLDQSKTVLNGKKLSEWEEKQQEYDKQRLDLVKEWHQK